MILILQGAGAILLSAFLAVMTTKGVERQAIRSAEKLNQGEKCGVLWAMREDWPVPKWFNTTGDGPHIEDETYSRWLGDHVVVCSADWPTDAARKESMKGIQEWAYDNEDARLMKARRPR